MSDAYSPPVEKEKTFEGNDAVADAAKHLDSQRTAEPEPTPRKYFNVESGAEIPPNETLDIKRAAVDISRARTQEAEAAFGNDMGVVADVVDHVRGVDAQQQPQPVEQPQPTAEQAEQIEFERALSNPKLRSALEVEIGRLEQSRSQYAAAASQAFDLSAAAVYSQFGDVLNGVDYRTLPTVLNVLQKVNPERHAAVVRALQSTEQLYRASHQAQSAQAEIAKAKEAVWIRNESDKYERLMADEPKEVQAEVEKNALRILKESYGIEPQALFDLVRSNVGLRSSEAQRLLYDAVKTKLQAEKIAAKKIPAHIPPVIRPGTSTSPLYNDEEATSARKAFDKNPNPKTAAAFLQARRNARG